MDNQPAQKVSGVRETIESVGARLLYLTPYSPDFNPIEMAFSKLKALLRQTAAGTIGELWGPSQEPLKCSRQPNASTTSPLQDMTWI